MGQANQTLSWKLQRTAKILSGRAGHPLIGRWAIFCGQDTEPQIALGGCSINVWVCMHRHIVTRLTLAWQALPSSPFHSIPYTHMHVINKLFGVFLTLHLSFSSGLHRPKLFSPWRVYSWRVSLSARLGWSELWDCQGYVPGPVFRSWHLQHRNQHVYLWQELDWARLLFRCVKCLMAWLVLCEYNNQFFKWFL